MLLSVCFFLVPTAMASLPPLDCVGLMNGWCNDKSHCPNKGGEKVALYDRSFNSNEAEWRCYDVSTLDPTKSKYINGTNYCTRAELKDLVEKCVGSNVRSIVFDHGESGFPCIRIPAITQVGDGILLAFAECRQRTGDGCIPSTHTPRNLSSSTNEYVCMKRSTDGGRTWSDLTFPFTQKITSAQPTVVYDEIKKTVILQNQANGSNYQVMSGDNGLSWSEPVDIGSFLGKWRGTSVGPGRGLQLKHSDKAGRLLFIGHHGAYVDDVVWYSDDHGKTYSLSDTVFPHMDEAQLVELSDGGVMANMRNKHFLPGDARGVSVSNKSGDFGVSFGLVHSDPALIEPVCMASIISNDQPGGQRAREIPGGPLQERALYFANPNTTSGRTHLTIKKSIDDGKTWPPSLQKLVYAGDAAYCCLTTVAEAGLIGLLWETNAESCSGPSCRIMFSVFDQHSF